MSLCNIGNGDHGEPTSVMSNVHTGLNYLAMAIKTNKMVARRLTSNVMMKMGMAMPARRVVSIPGCAGMMVAVGVAVLTGVRSVGCAG